MKNGFMWEKATVGWKLSSGEKFVPLRVEGEMHNFLCLNGDSREDKYCRIYW